MEMPTPCENCGQIFDLDEGTDFAGTIYCAECGDDFVAKEEKEDELNDAKESLKNAKTEVIYWECMVEKLQKEYDDFD